MEQGTTLEKKDESMTDLTSEDQHLGEFAMPFLADKSEKTRADSLDNHLPHKTGRQLDVAMESFDSNDNLPNSSSTEHGEANSATPINLQMYSESPLNKYIDTRSYGSPTKEENTDTSLSPRPKFSPLPSKENILEIECDEMNDDKNAHSYSYFLKKHSCYDIIPNSTKIVVFDTRLKVKKAFFALVHNGIRSAPLWDSSEQEFVGMLTITDFINILIRYYKSPLEKMWELEEHQIQTWRTLIKKNIHSRLLRISPTESLFTGVQMLMKNKIHRLPVIDEETGNAMYIITHKKILAYLYQHLDDLGMPDFLGRTIQEIGIGSFTNIAMIRPTTKLIDAMNIFHDRGVSALPVVDEENKCVDVYSRFDVMNLAAERTYNNLDITVNEALLYRQISSEGVFRCHPDETFYAIIDRIVNAKVHRLVTVDKENHILGIVSLSDILRFLVDPPKIVY